MTTTSDDTMRRIIKAALQLCRAALEVIPAARAHDAAQVREALRRIEESAGAIRADLDRDEQPTTD